MGVGSGTFAVFICMIISVLICFFRHMFSFPNGAVFLAVMFPVIVFLIIYSMPTGDPVDSETGETIKQEDRPPTSWYLVKVVVFTTLLAIMMLMSCCALLSQKIQSFHVRRMDSEI